MSKRKSTENFSGDSNPPPSAKDRKLNNTDAIKSVDFPPNWKIIYENIVKMRINKDAPIDSFGCDRCQDDHAEVKVRRFQALVSLMLSSQTKDEVTYKAMERLKGRGLTLDFIENISTGELENLLKPVGFYRRKTEYLKKTVTILKEQYEGDIPDTVEDLIKLPGVGPKMAHLTMKVAWNKITGIAVDTHVHRISNRFEWAKTKTPEKTQGELESWVPKEYWNDFNHNLVGFGQSICLPVHPKCVDCLNRKICPASQCKK